MVRMVNLQAIHHFILFNCPHSPMAAFLEMTQVQSRLNDTNYNLSKSTYPLDPDTFGKLFTMMDTNYIKADRKIMTAISWTVPLHQRVVGANILLHGPPKRYAASDKNTKEKATSSPSSSTSDMVPVPLLCC